MKTQKSPPGYIKLIQSNMVLFGLLIGFLSVAHPADDNPLNKSLLSVTSNNSVIATQNGELSKDISWLAPTTPAEVDFSDETEDIVGTLAKTSDGEASFEENPDLINSSVMEFLAPKTPLVAYFNN